MSDNKGDLSAFLKSETEKWDGIMVSVKASFPERVLIKKVPIEKLHPNPDDEFCWPSIGPNFSIISDYEARYQRYGTMKKPEEIVEEPIMVEKVYPDGYRILNGHHRWAAYRRIGVKKIGVSIVNLTQATDIENMLKSSKHDKLITMDLDEVIFCQDENEPAEKALPFPFNRMYKERLHLGVPGLLHEASKHGYDIWVYTAKYYSLEYIRAYLKKYSIKVDGIITGTARKMKDAEAAKKKTAELLENTYKETIHVDRKVVMRTFSDSDDFEDYELTGPDTEWSREVMNIIRGFNGDEKDQ